MSNNPNPGSSSPTPAGGDPINYATASTPTGLGAYSGAAPDQDSKTMGMLAHLLGIFGILGPRLIWLIKKDKSPFVNDQGKEAVNWHITAIIAFVALFILSFVVGLIVGLAKIAILSIVVGCFFWLLIGVVWVCNLIFSIMGGMTANKGTAYRYPFALRLIK